jgi:hypothetical protein
MGPIREYLALVIVTWMTLAPFVVFQALLCARDDYQQEYYGEARKHYAPTATETVMPILVILGWVWISATAVSFRINTAYQVRAMLGLFFLVTACQQLKYSLII